MSWLEVKNLTLAFGGLKAVDNLSFSVEPDTVYTIIGPNGAGKSTVFNLICRIYDPVEGDVRLGGESLCPPSRTRSCAVALPGRSRISSCSNMPRCWTTC